MVFGSPVRENKFLFIGYWFFVSFYFLFLSFALVIGMLSGYWIPVVIFAITAPLLFRVVYYFKTVILKRMTKKGIVMITGAFVVFTFGVIGATFLFAENLAVNVSKTVYQGNLEVSIGSLKGEYLVDDPSIIQEGAVVIPYQASVGDGSFTLVVERADEIVWEEDIIGASEGFIEFVGEESSYDIRIYTEQAKEVLVNLTYQR
ncbi:hypothetical protein [Alteribacter aurantiacus]|uniref:hypothetical protein n=1 Tax=Alteribacter aurantiacus TaxID=254410 RepID=UPI00047ED165|nr:hypothetical protein [Alteribacter aurantiacus]